MQNNKETIKSWLVTLITHFTVKNVSLIILMRPNIGSIFILLIGTILVSGCFRTDSVSKFLDLFAL